jgi:hypothetical protein
MNNMQLNSMLLEANVNKGMIMKLQKKSTKNLSDKKIETKKKSKTSIGEKNLDSAEAQYH